MLSGIGDSFILADWEANGKAGYLGTTKTPPEGGVFVDRWRFGNLQSRLNLKAPGFKESLRNVLGIFVPTSPLAQTGRPDVLIRCELELLDDLFKGGHGGYNGADGLRLAPIRISSTFCHLVLFSLERSGVCFLLALGTWLGILVVLEQLYVFYFKDIFFKNQ
jgi:hypothetical protein